MLGRHRSILILAMAGVLAIVLVACAGGGAPASPAATPAGGVAPATTVAGTAAPAKGDANAGKQLIVSKGCSGCHVVPGVPEAKGTVGPSLAGVAGQPQIAGTLPNNPENMEKWLKNPPGVKPGTQMPNLGLSDKEVSDLVAFLTTLR